MKNEKGKEEEKNRERIKLKLIRKGNAESKRKIPNEKKNVTVDVLVEDDE